MKKEKKIVLAFDVDGNLIDIENIAYQLYYQAFKTFFIERNDEYALSKTEEKMNPKNGGQKWFFQNITGNGNDLLLKIINKEIASPEKPINPLDFTNFRLNVERKIIDFVSPDNIFPGIIEMLSDLSRMNNIIFYLISGSLHERLSTELIKTKLIKFFKNENNIFSGDDFITKTEPINYIVQKEQIDPECIIFSGDALSDILAAKKAINGKGIYVIGNVTREDKDNIFANMLLKNGADDIVHGGKELHSAIIKRINQIRAKDYNNS